MRVLPSYQNGWRPPSPAQNPSSDAPKAGMGMGNAPDLSSGGRKLLSAPHRTKLIEPILPGYLGGPFAYRSAASRAWRSA